MNSRLLSQEVRHLIEAVDQRGVHLGAHLAQFGSFVLLDQVIDQEGKGRSGPAFSFKTEAGLLHRSSWFPPKSKSGRFEF
jgi:hypothetical protein